MKKLFSLLAVPVAALLLLQTCSPPPQPNGQPATLGELWGGTAGWHTLQDSPTHPLANGAGLHIVDQGGTWRAFYRQNIPTAPGCGSVVPNSFQTVTASSTDEGATWTAPVLVAGPAPGTASACGVTDGGPVFDGTKWFYIAQCLDSSPLWRLCSYQRAATDPNGPWTTVANPIFPEDNHLSTLAGITNTNQDGTPDVFRSSGGWFYVSFHTVASDGKHSYRGAAATTDFATTWSAGAPRGEPTGPMLSTYDCLQWQSDCVGPADSNILAEGGQNYQLTESPNVSISCDPSQTWTSGLLRAPTLAASGGWANFAGNPMESGAGSCTLNYQQLFKSGNFYYWAYLFNRGDGYHFTLKRLEQLS